MVGLEVGSMAGSEAPDRPRETPVRHFIFGSNTAMLNVPCWYDDTSDNCTHASACVQPFQFENDANVFIEAARLWNSNRDAALEMYGSIEDWDTSRLRGLGGQILAYALGENFNGDISKWDVGRVSSLAYQFSGLKSFNQDLSRWDTTKVTTMLGVFKGASAFNQDLNTWQTSSVTMVNEMFSRALRFNGNVADWDTSRIYTSVYMFYKAESFNQDLSKWNVSAIGNMNRMFHEAYQFNSDITRWTPRKVEILESFLFMANEFNQDLSCWSVFFGNRTLSSFYTPEFATEQPPVFPHSMAVPCWFDSNRPDCTQGTDCDVTTRAHGGLRLEHGRNSEPEYDPDVVGATKYDDQSAAGYSVYSSCRNQMDQKQKKQKLGYAGVGAIVGAGFIGVVAVAVVLFRQRFPKGRARTIRAHGAHSVSDARHLQENLYNGELLLRRLTQGMHDLGGGATAKLVRQIAHASRARAEARFVIDYRQLVTSRSMEEFQHEFRKLEVPRASIALGHELGRGQSGVVLLGSLVRRPSDHEECGDSNSAADRADGTAARGGSRAATMTRVDVAIKTHLDNGTFDREALVMASNTVGDEALLLEAMLLNGLRHPGILRLVGMVTESAPVLLCTELMPNGDLRKYLRACRPNKANRIATVTVTDMVSIAAVLASAMAYLERQSIIHRDIAARNVLVGATSTEVKVADLGAARNVHRTNTASDNGVYTATTDHNPARWMPLEALQDAQFSHKSDVFAFGVLLWEIMSLGQTPWGAFGVSDFVAALQSGDRLQFPAAVEHSQIAQTMYGIALRCWSNEPRKRPPFSSLEGELAAHRTVATAAVATSTPRSVACTSIGRDQQPQQQHVELDTDGYVEEFSAPFGNEDFDEATGGLTDVSHASLVGEDGYFLDQQHVADFDEDGYVQDVSDATV
jgi:surface protein